MSKPTNKNTGVPPKKPAGFKYAPKFGVIAICKDERDQRRTYNKMIKQFQNVRVVTV